MEVAASFFETEFRRRIKFVPEYFELNKVHVEYLDSSRPDISQTIGPGKLTWAAPAKDLVEFSSMINFMKRFRLVKARETAIDLGGAEGTCAALFRANGLAKHVTNVDILDFSAVTGPDYFKEFLAILKSGSMRTALEPVISRAKQNFDYLVGEAYDVGLYIGHAELAVIDENLHGDVLAVKGKYDLVSAFSCFEHLDLHEALAKASELLNEGGLFVCQNELWYWVVGSLGVIGHFPYADARLTHADIDRYLCAYHPTLVQGYRSRLSKIRQAQDRPTIKDWFDIGRKNGLRPVAVERVMPHWHSQIAQCPVQLFQEPYFDHREVLADIHMFQPDVTVDDLLTSAIRIAMIKV